MISIYLIYLSNLSIDLSTHPFIYPTYRDPSLAGVAGIS